jgi:endonuclease/exonuclease/phosphatase family metal-dependent hydrolase
MFKVATFNAGLAVGVLPNVSERLPLVLQALSALDVDLLFVQEFWLESHWTALCARLQGRLPHTLRPKPLGAAPGCCTEQDLMQLRACGSRHCAGLRDEALAACIVRHCASVALSLPVDCVNCLASDPRGTLEEILERCTAVDNDSEGALPAREAPTQSAHGGLMAYGGSFGTGLLLRSPAAATDVLTFESSINARGALFARLTRSGLGPLDVFATHLSPGGAEQVPQVERLLSWIEEKSGAGPALLLGDLNASPGSALLGRIRAAGFHEGRASALGPTYSSEGLTSGRFTGSGWHLDHVLVRGLNAATSRILDEPRTLEVAGHQVPSTLSDHAGLLSVIEQAERGR